MPHSNSKNLLFKTILLSLSVTSVCACAPSLKQVQDRDGDQSKSRIKFDGRIQDEHSLIYGSDGRKELYEMKDPKLIDLARATVTVVSKTEVIAHAAASYFFSQPLFGAIRNLCSTERFANQPTLGFCSGVLVAPDLILTAAHCVPDTLTCQDSYFVFDYAYNGSGKSLSETPASTMYECKQIIKWAGDPDTHDFALIQLDRIAENRIPVKVGAAATTKLNDRVFAIGHPYGLPLKFALDGVVRHIDRIKQSFIASLDTYDGNSGSPIFNSKTLGLEGILVDGAYDLKTIIMKDKKTLQNVECNVSNQCAENGCTGEIVTSINAFADAVRAYISNVVKGP